MVVSQNGGPPKKGYHQFWEPPLSVLSSKPYIMWTRSATLNPSVFLLLFGLAVGLSGAMLSASTSSGLLVRNLNLAIEPNGKDNGK